ncbi:MAG: UDP-N-acetylmuramoyl-tripeptide--D-alanyl-D-alanine ligase [Syntrophomonas sp.]
MNLELGFICDSIKGVLLNTNPQKKIKGITTDSRRIKAGQLFFALSGANFDGHSFLGEVFKNGATAAVVSKTSDKLLQLENRSLILVDDTLQALQDLARAYRSQFSIPVVAVTGSVGKTTTKEILDCCLKQSFKTHKTKGNYNNDIGLPLTIMELENKHQAAVIELAMRAPGEIARLAKIARPNYALITNVAPVHLETMGSIEAIAQAKCEVLAELDASGFAVLNGDNEALLKAASIYPCRKYTFGCSPLCDFYIKKVEIERKGIAIETRFMEREEKFWFPLPAVRLSGNVVAAAAVAYLLGAELQDIKSGLAEYKSSGHRLHLISLAAGGMIINDSYNANPLSMAAALETGHELKGNGRLVAVLGDMFELGDYELEGHLEVGRTAAENGVEMLVTIGPRARFIAQGAEDAGMNKEQIHHFATKEQGVEFLHHNIDQYDTVLFKASRGMGMETMVDNLLQGMGTHQ